MRECRCLSFEDLYEAIGSGNETGNEAGRGGALYRTMKPSGILRARCKMIYKRNGGVSKERQNDGP